MFRCKSCGHNEYPEDAILGILPGMLSAGVAQKACLLAAMSPFEQAAELLHRLSDLQVSPDTIEKISEKTGALIHEQECEQGRQLAEKNLVDDKTDQATDTPELLYMQADGAMINTREEGWKENKLAMAFCESDIKRSGAEENERISIEKKDFVSSMGEGLSKFRNLVHLLALRVGAFKAREVVVIADGAPWIRNMFASLLPKAIFILDWYHVTEHLWKCSKQIFGEKSSQCKVWVEQYKDLIWNGKIEQALECLLKEADSAKNQTPLRDLYSYFNSRRDCMSYADFRNRGFYIGSGSIESANKYVIQDRLKRAGMKWSFRGANAIAALRLKFLSGNWDKIWEPKELAFA